MAQDGPDGQGGSVIWAPLMRFRLKPGKDTAGLREQLQAVEQSDSGLLRTLIMQDHKDPDQFCTLVVFESEEKARARTRPAPPGGVAGPSGDAGRQARGSAGVHRSGCRGGVDRAGGRPVQATYSNPCALRLLRASIHIRTKLRCLTATRTVPIVCIQMVIPGSVPIACPMGRSKPVRRWPTARDEPPGRG